MGKETVKESGAKEPDAGGTQGDADSMQTDANGRKRTQMDAGEGPSKLDWICMPHAAMTEGRFLRTIAESGPMSAFA
jgi:hypothetical protein